MTAAAPHQNKPLASRTNMPINATPQLNYGMNIADTVQEAL